MDTERYIKILPCDIEEMHRKVADEEDNHKGNHHQGSFFSFIFLGSGTNAFDRLIFTDISNTNKIIIVKNLSQGPDAILMTNHIIDS